MIEFCKLLTQGNNLQNDLGDLGAIYARDDDDSLVSPSEAAELVRAGFMAAGSSLGKRGIGVLEGEDADTQFGDGTSMGGSPLTKKRIVSASEQSSDAEGNLITKKEEVPPAAIAASENMDVIIETNAKDDNVGGLITSKVPDDKHDAKQLRSSNSSPQNPSVSVYPSTSSSSSALRPTGGGILLQKSSTADLNAESFPKSEVPESADNTTTTTQKSKSTATDAGKPIRDTVVCFVRVRDLQKLLFDSHFQNVVADEKLVRLIEERDLSNTATELTPVCHFEDLASPETCRDYCGLLERPTSKDEHYIPLIVRDPGSNACAVGSSTASPSITFRAVATDAIWFKPPNQWRETRDDHDPGIRYEVSESEHLQPHHLILVNLLGVTAVQQFCVQREWTKFVSGSCEHGVAANCWKQMANIDSCEYYYGTRSSRMMWEPLGRAFLASLSREDALELVAVDGDVIDLPGFNEAWRLEQEFIDAVGERRGKNTHNQHFDCAPWRYFTNEEIVVSYCRIGAGGDIILDNTKYPEICDNKKLVLNLLTEFGGEAKTKCSTGTSGLAVDLLHISERLRGDRDVI
jgi:hypothetical protein